MVDQTEGLPEAPEGYEWVPVSDGLPEAPEGYEWVPEGKTEPPSYLSDVPYVEAAARDFISSATDAMTFGLSRPLQTLGVTAADYFVNPDTEESFLDRYKRAGDFVTKREEARFARSPLASFAGSIVGSIPSGAAFAPAKAATQATKHGLRQYGRGIVRGMAIGGGVGAADELTKQVAQGDVSPKTLATRGTIDALLSGALTAGVGPIAYVGKRALGDVVKRLPDGTVAIPAVVRGMDALKKIARDKEALTRLLSLGKKQGASSVLDIQSPTVSEAISAVGATPAGSRIEADIIDRSVRRNPSLAAKVGVGKDSFLGNEVTPTGKLSRMESALSDKYSELNSAMMQGGSNITKADLQSVLDESEMSVLEGYIAMLKRTDPFASVWGDIKSGVSPYMVDAVIQGPLSQAAKFGPTSVQAKNLIWRLRNVVDSKYPGFAQRSKDYAAKFEYEAGVKAFKPGMSDTEFKAVRKTLTPMEDRGFVDSMAAYHLEQVSPSSSAMAGLRGRTATAELVGRAGSGAVYSVPAAAGQGLRGFLDVKGRLRGKQIPSDLADALQLTPEQALDYLRAKGVYKPGTYTVPFIQGYEKFNKEEE